MKRPRPMVGSLTVPYMVDDRRSPIDFKILHPYRVERCATQQRCGICGLRIRGMLAFLGDARTCFADPWMHVECAELARVQCPFVAGRREWREEGARSDELLAPYARMVLVVAGAARSHRDALGGWHFETVGRSEVMP